MEFRYFLTLGAAGGICLYPKALPNAQALCSAELSRGLPFSDYLCTSSASRYLRVSVCLFLGPSRSLSPPPRTLPPTVLPPCHPRLSVDLAGPPGLQLPLQTSPTHPGPQGPVAGRLPGQEARLSPPLTLRLFASSSPPPPLRPAPPPLRPFLLRPLPPPLLPLCPLRFLLPLPSGPPASQAGEGRCPRSASPAGPDLASWVTRRSGLWG